MELMIPDSSLARNVLSPSCDSLRSGKSCRKLGLSGESGSEKPEALVESSVLSNRCLGITNLPLFLQYQEVNSKISKIKNAYSIFQKFS